MFVDHIRVHAKAGDGGNGCVSFRREAHVPRGGPDGGDGGAGGSIILRADPHTDTLVAFFYDPKLFAENGARGKRKQMSGKTGGDKIVLVPVGTLVYRLPPEESLRGARQKKLPQGGKSRSPGEPTTTTSPQDLKCVADLTVTDQEFVLCRGGRGARGNVHFKSARNQAPTRHDFGEPGEEGYFLFELRMMADVGLVGYPNAGKSTLLGKLSAAHPKVAPYPFTTLHPTVGVLDLPDHQRATVADIPGLIAGAHRDVGLGHDFLRHISRCQLLVFVIDMAGSEGRSPLEDFATLRQELSLYDPSLLQRSQLVVANKMDLPDADENLRLFAKRYPLFEIAAISAKNSAGLSNLSQLLAKQLMIS